MKKKSSNIKERIKQVAENKGIPLGVFFKKLEVSPTGFTGIKIEKGINSDTIQKLISIYPEIDLHWLITGEPKKAVIEVNDNDIEYKKARESVVEEGYKKLLAAKDETIAILKHQLGIGNNGNSKAS